MLELSNHASLHFKLDCRLLFRPKTNTGLSSNKSRVSELQPDRYLYVLEQYLYLFRRSKRNRKHRNSRCSHTVISGTDTTTCSSFLDNPDCYIAEEKCIEGPETRIINGVAVYKECWKKELAFACAAPGASNSCQILASKGCQPIGEKVCERVGADGTCAQYSQKYHCVNTDPIEAMTLRRKEHPLNPVLIF